MHSLDSSVNAQSFNLNLLEERYHWIDNLDYHDDCQYNGQWPCSNQFCYRHGLAKRIDLQEKILSLGQPTQPAYFITLSFACLVPPSVTTKARDKWLYFMRREYPNLEYLWRLHFKWKQPHFHFLVIANETEQAIVKGFWIPILAELGHSNPSQPDVYCKPVESWEGSIAYLFQTTHDQNPIGEDGKRRLRKQDNPARIKFCGRSKSYRYGGKSKHFPGQKIASQHSSKKWQIF